MNSNDPNFDWHRKGVYIAISPNGLPMLETVANTAYSCRASLVMSMNKRWSALVAAGVVIQEFVQAEPVNIRMQEQVTSNETRWRYVAREPAPSGEVLLLTIGRVTVTGHFKDDGSYIAWAPKIQRDKELEKELGLL